MKSMNKAVAFFLRTRRPDIRRLDRKPQENLGTVHKILSGAVKDSIDKVKKLERGFYGLGRHAQDEITKYMPYVLAVLQASHISHLNSLVAINDIIQRSQDPNIQFEVDPFALNKLKECLRKISDVIPAKFSELVLELRRILKYLDKYCLSFYDIEGHVFIDTGHYYERQRRFLRNEVKRHLDRIDILYEKFRKSVLIHTEMGSYARELARKTDSERAPFLLLFPESAECIKVACSACMSWIDADSHYATFIANDINNLGLKKEEVSKVLRTCQEKFHQLHIRWTEVKKDYEKTYGEIGKLYDREDELLLEEECLMNEYSDVQEEIEQKELRREALLKNMNHMCEELLYEKYSEVSDSLRELKMRLPLIDRALANLRYKLTWIGEQKEKLKASYKEFEDVQDEMERENQMKMEKDIELNALLETLDLARQIHLHKTSPDAIEKIFYEQPVFVNNTRLPGMKGKDDPFERACAVVHEEIRDDWARLYRALPWVPPRSDMTIDREIEEFAVSATRIGSKDTSRRVLHRWRRFHTRAKLEDLKEGLLMAKRQDIVGKIEQQLSPPAGEEGEVEDEAPSEATPPDEPPTVNNFLEPDLLPPLLKEVERLDELTATAAASEDL